MSAGRRLVAQVLEDLRVAEELGHLDQEAADEPGVLLRVGLELLRVAGERRVARRAHPAAQPADDRRGLVGAEVDAAPLPDPVEQGRELAGPRDPSGAVPPAASRSRRTAPIESRSAVASTSDGEIERGIDGNIAVAGFSMTTAPPACLTCHAPADPSLPLPVRITAVRPGPERGRRRLEQQIDRRRDAARPWPVEGAARRRRSRPAGSTGRRR